MGDQIAQFSSSSSAATMSVWSAIPSDLLHLISALLASYLDYTRLRAVCSAWRSAVPKRPHPLLLVGRHKDDITYSFRGILSGSHLSPLPPSAVSVGTRLCSFSCGWMAYIDPISMAVTLFNPVTKSQIQLPPLYSQMDGASKKMNVKDFQIVLSSDPSVVASEYVVMITSDQGLAFYRSGDDAWIVAAGAEPDMFHYYFDKTACTFYDGRFFVLRSGVLVCSVEADTAVVERIRPGGPGFRTKGYYLVESAGDLLYVFLLKKGECYDARIYRLDFQQQNILRVRRGLRNRTLFLDQKQCFSFSAGEFPGCKGNHIYLVESAEITLINLRDGSYECLFGDPADIDWQPFAWFAPRLA